MTRLTRLGRVSQQPASSSRSGRFVAAGRARFTIDGESHHAPTGTYVFPSLAALP